MTNKLPSTYRAEHEAIVRDVCHLAGIVQMSVATGKQGITHTSLIAWLQRTLDRAGVAPLVDLNELMAAAEANEAKAKANPKPSGKPELQAVK